MILCGAIYRSEFYLQKDLLLFWVKMISIRIKSCLYAFLVEPTLSKFLNLLHFTKLGSIVVSALNLWYEPKVPQSHFAQVGIAPSAEDMALVSKEQDSEDCPALSLPESWNDIPFLSYLTDQRIEGITSFRVPEV